ncbi:MAG: hypothetical protein LBI48_09415 [Burkholderiaceae bacterium]|jgi:hypothetical protein|nr:hypothetical protein [Burkholderiaceae bacterium]
MKKFGFRGAMEQETHLSGSMRLWGDKPDLAEWMDADGPIVFYKMLGIIIDEEPKPIAVLENADG